MTKIDHPLPLRVILGQDMKHCIYQSAGGRPSRMGCHIWHVAIQSIVLMHGKGACEPGAAVVRSKECVACVGVGHFETSCELPGVKS
jgi:hypothetical protein